MRRRNRRSRRTVESGMESGMTPMIDVVFQLLIYFLVTFSTADVVAHLAVARPAPDTKATPERPPPDLIRVDVLAEGLLLDGRAVSHEELDGLLEQLAALSTKQTVLVSCADEAPHERLVQVLDLCAAHGMEQIAVVNP